MIRILIIMATVILTGCTNYSGFEGQTPAQQPTVWEFQQLPPQTYTPPDWPQALTASVYQPIGIKRAPAVLVVHGGGWARRSPADMQRICKALASRGFVAVNVAYRLAPDHLYPAPVLDLRQALDWMVANASTLNIDPGRIGAFGYSAGAHLVSLLAVLETGRDPQWDASHRPHRLKAIVAGGTPADLTRWPKSPLVNQFIGEGFKDNREKWIAASPISHVTPSAPPFFLYHGGFDQLVEVEQAHALKARLDDAGVHAELYTVPYHGHFSMFLLNRSAVHQGAEFLRRHL